LPDVTFDTPVRVGDQVIQILRRERGFPSGRLPGDPGRWIGDPGPLRRLR
jgi:hypothetical protein